VAFDDFGEVGPVGVGDVGGVGDDDVICEIRRHGGEEVALMKGDAVGQIMPVEVFLR